METHASTLRVVGNTAIISNHGNLFESPTLQPLFHDMQVCGVVIGSEFIKNVKVGYVRVPNPSNQDFLIHSKRRM